MTVAVRKQGDWMSKNDERILEFLHSADRCRPREIREGLEQNGISLRVEYVDKRLEKLDAAGMVVSDAMRYQISDRGHEYLVGGYDATTSSAP